jgi:hypothetical protein
VVRFVAILAAAVAAVAVPSAMPAAPPPTPGCPDLEGWTLAGPPLTIDNGLHLQFRCAFAQPGRAEQASFDAFWTTPAARDADVDFHECGKAPDGGSYYRDIWSGKAFVQIEYRVEGGTQNAGVFQAERERLDRAALQLMSATEKLAKSCVKKDTVRPSIHVRGVRGPAATTLAFPFSVADASGRANVVLTVYDTRAKAKVLVRKKLGWLAAGIHSAHVRVASRGAHIWCITATDAAGNTATACGAVVVT